MSQHKLFIILCVLLIGLMFQAGIGSGMLVCVEVDQETTAFDVEDLDAGMKSQAGAALALVDDHLFNQPPSFYHTVFLNHFSTLNSASAESAKEFKHSPPVLRS